jgi:hypothetical protein
MGAGAAFALLPKATRNLVLGSASIGVGAAAVVISVKSYYYRQAVDEILQERRSKYKTIGMDSSTEFDYLKTVTNINNNKLQ